VPVQRLFFIHLCCHGKSTTTFIARS